MALKMVVWMAQTSEITYDEFRRVELRVCRVMKAERIPGRSRLLKLTVDLGGETRTVVAGGGEYYNPEYFEGKLMIIVANLKPKRIAGVESQGMLLAAVVGDKPFWLTVDGDVPPGSIVM